MGYSWGGGTRKDYLPRYKAFYERIKAVHPEIVTIANIHTEPDAAADVVDEHYYENSEWFFKAAGLYDNYDRTKPKLYVGEYAVRKDAGNGNMRAALAEAAFLTGLERNSDVVAMSSYAPMFTNPQWQKWKPDAVVFNNKEAYGTPSYHVQALFAGNRPDVVLPVEVSQPTSGGAATLYAVAGRKKVSGDYIVKVVNRGDRAEDLDVEFTGVPRLPGKCVCTELSASSVTDENSFAEPKKVFPKVSKLAGSSGPFKHTFLPYSVTVLRWVAE
jgi:alpha-L-arabinofuranosidase